MSWLKDPADTADYRFDWDRWLTSSDTIASASVTVPAGLTKGAVSHDQRSATVWLSGGAAGNYAVVCSITTTEGRTAERTKQLTVRDR